MPQANGGSGHHRHTSASSSFTGQNRILETSIAEERDRKAMNRLSSGSMPGSLDGYSVHDDDDHDNEEDEDEEGEADDDDDGEYDEDDDDVEQHQTEMVDDEFDDDLLVAGEMDKVPF